VYVKITFRPTPRQILGRTLFIGVFACAVALLPVAVAMAVRREWDLVLLGVVVVLVAVVAVLVAVRGAVHVGVALDERGVHPLEPGPARQGYCANWRDIEDIRAERRGGRTVPVVYFADGGTRPWRLRAPYSGRGLAVDPELDEKIFIMRSLWETYRNGPAPLRNFRSG
jgi:hypothetical protein